VRSECASGYSTNYHVSMPNVGTPQTDLTSESDWSNTTTAGCNPFRRNSVDSVRSSMDRGQGTFARQGNLAYPSTQRLSYADVLGAANRSSDDGLDIARWTGARKSVLTRGASEQDVVIIDQRKDPMSIRSVRKSRYKKLILTLGPDQII